VSFWGELSRWATLLQWDLIAALALFDSFREWRVARRVYRLAVALGNGRVVVATFRKKIAGWFLLGFVIAWCCGMLATYAAIALPPPPPDTTVVTSVIREALCVLIFSFWRAKRNNRQMRLTFEDQRDASAVLKERADQLQDTADDTNERVREIQERGLSDQPHEQADRDEGREHREPRNGGE